MKNKIYLDNNATTPLDPRVASRLKEEIDNGFGNPSSVHSWGRDARNKITKARRTIADYFKVRPGEFLFTSSATEAVNLVMRSLPPGKIITSRVEHSCIFETAKTLEQAGRPVAYLPTGEWGAVTAEQVQKEAAKGSACILLSAVNSETGVKTDIEAIGLVAEELGIPFFVDAAQIVGKESFSPPRGVAGFSISGHKFHAPKGIGGLWLSPKLKLAPLMTGGGQEYNKRAGTENVFGILGMAEAIQVLSELGTRPFEQMRALRDLFEAEIRAIFPALLLNGRGERVSNTSNLSFPGLEGEAILMNLDLQGVGASHGSACSSGSLEPSRVLLEMGLSKERASASVRFSFSRFNTEEEVLETVRLLLQVLES